MQHTSKAGRLVSRYVRSLAISKGMPQAAAAFAEGRNWDDRDDVVRMLKAAVPAGVMADRTGVLRPLATDLANLVRPATVIGKLQGLRRVPFLCRMLEIDAGSSASWVEEGHAIPVAELHFVESSEQLSPRKIATIIPQSRELAESSNPSSDAIISSDIRAALSAAIDQAFCDVFNPGSAASPPGIGYGGTTVPSSGSTLSQIDTDLGLMVRLLPMQGGRLATAAWVLSEQTAAYMANLRGTGGTRAFEGLSPLGGTILGLPAVVSAAAQTLGSPTSTTLMLLDQDGCSVADDDGGEVVVSAESSLVLTTNPSTGAQQLRDLFQNNEFATRASRFVNWGRRRHGATVVLTGVNF